MPEPPNPIPAPSGHLGRLRPDIAIIPMDGAVQLRSGDEEIYTLRTDSAALAADILARLDGRNSRQTLLEALGHQHADLVDALLRELTSHRLLTNDLIQTEDDVSLYLGHFAGNQGPAEAALGSCTVAVIGHAPLVRLMAENLQAHRLGVRPCPWDEAEPPPPKADVWICLWERPDLHRIEGVNTAACRAGRPVLFADLSHGQHATIGPFFIPGEGACYACYRDRLRQNAASYPEHVAAEQWMRDHRAALPAHGLLPTFRYQVVGLAGSELVAFATRYRPLRTLNRAVVVDLERLKSWSEPVWRIPWCPSCGMP